MSHALDVLIAVQGQSGVTYAPRNEQPFSWHGCIVGAERSAIEEHESGDLLKVLRLDVHGPTTELVRRGVTKLDREATVSYGGQTWNVDLLESTWGPNMVRLGLIRRPIARHTEMESHDGAIR